MFAVPITFTPRLRFQSARVTSSPLPIKLAALRTVDKIVHPSPLRDNLHDSSRAGGSVGDIHGVKGNALSCVGQLGGKIFSGDGIHIQHGDRGAFRCKFPHRRLTNTGGPLSPRRLYSTYP
jgi:hypothetical protein